MLARALGEGELTVSEIAELIDKPPGSFFGVLKRMVGDGLVVTDSGAPARGTRYSLSAVARQLLRTAGGEHISPGAVEPSQKLMLVGSPGDLPRAQKVLAQDWISSMIAWAAEVEGGWLLGLDLGSSYPEQRLRMALEEAGASVRQLSIDEVMSGVELRNRATWLLDDLAQSLLTPKPPSEIGP
jgi:DNA-binding MarR family transcriptional regulator